VNTWEGQTVVVGREALLFGLFLTKEMLET